MGHRALIPLLLIALPTIARGAGVSFVQPPGSPLATGMQPISIAIGDFNNDGKLDLVTADFNPFNRKGGGTVSILLGNGDGTFQPPRTFPSGGNDPVSVAVGGTGLTLIGDAGNPVGGVTFDGAQLCGNVTAAGMYRLAIIIPGS